MRRPKYVAANDGQHPCHPGLPPARKGDPDTGEAQGMPSAPLIKLVGMSSTVDGSPCIKGPERGNVPFPSSAAHIDSPP